MKELEVLANLAILGASKKLANIEAELDDIKSLILTIPGSTGGYLTINAIQLSAGDWGGGNPQSLYQIVDGDENTWSDWALGYGGGNKGWIKVDLNSVIDGTVEIKSDIALNASYASNTIKYFIEVSSNNSNWTVIHEQIVTMTTSGEIKMTSTIFSGRYLRWGLLDIGQGAGKMRSASLKVQV